MHGVAVAMLIVSSWRVKHERPEKLADARQAIVRFSRQRQFAWRIGDETDDDAETYIFMDIVKG